MKIYLHGALAKLYGNDPIELDVKTPQMMICGLSSQLPDFRNKLKLVSDKVAIIVKDKDNADNSYSVQQFALTIPFVNSEEVHLVPEISGAGIEVALVAMYTSLGAVSAAATLATITFQIGVSLILGAVTKMLAPSPDTSGNGNEAPDERASFIFNGAVNTVAQGGVIPLVYGKCMTGSVVISTDVDVVELPIPPDAVEPIPEVVIDNSGDYVP